MTTRTVDAAGNGTEHVSQLDSNGNPVPDGDYTCDVVDGHTQATPEGAGSDGNSGTNDGSGGYTDGGGFDGGGGGGETTEPDPVMDAPYDDE